MQFIRMPTAVSRADQRQSRNGEDNMCLSEMVKISGTTATSRQRPPRAPFLPLSPLFAESDYMLLLCRDGRGTHPVEVMLLLIESKEEPAHSH
jgi:hypothetical protein